MEKDPCSLTLCTCIILFTHTILLLWGSTKSFAVPSHCKNNPSLKLNILRSKFSWQSGSNNTPGALSVPDFTKVVKLKHVAQLEMYMVTLWFNNNAAAAKKK